MLLISIKTFISSRSLNIKIMASAYKTFQEALSAGIQTNLDNCAIEYSTKRVSYRQLWNRSIAIANQLERMNVLPQSYVAILVEDKAELIASIIGVLMSRRIFVPVEVGFPQNRIDVMLHKVSPSVAICCGDGHQRIINSQAHQNIPVLRVDRFEEKPNEVSLVKQEYQPIDKIYVYFTSGTTGDPKPILGKNESLLHFIDWEIKEFKIDREFRLSQFSTPVFDAFLKDTFPALLVGGTICIPTGTLLSYTPDELLRWLNESHVTLIQTVPSVFRLICSARLSGSDLADVKYIFLSGEKIVPAELKKWYEIFGSRIQLVNLYGATETTILKAFYLIQPEDVEKVRIPIGRMISGAKAIVLDQNLKICEQGEVGEIYVRTPYSTYGYIHDRDLNERIFVQNPFSSDPTDIIYKTGDLAQFLPDGNLDMLGRADRQIKFNGIRIEPAEIESCLLSSRLIEQCVVVKRDIGDRSELVAFILPNAKVEADEELSTSLREHMESKLPLYMIPSNIRIVSEIPLKVNGKRDDAQLLKELTESESSGKLRVPARNSIDQCILECYAEVLNLSSDDISCDDNFFKIGGHSLMAIKAVSRIFKKLEVKFPLQVFFKSNNIIELSDYIKSLKRSNPETIEKAPERSGYPASDDQLRLLFSHNAFPGSLAYNMPAAFIINGGLDTRKLDDAFSKLIARHETLRTQFRTIDGETQQEICTSVPFALQQLAHCEDKDALTDRIRNFIRPFQLDRAPLMRAGLGSYSDGKSQYLIVEFHHIIADGGSLDILRKDLIAFYNNGVLPDLRIQFKDYIWFEKNNGNDGLNQQKEYWRNQFQNLPPLLCLPNDYSRPKVKTTHGDSVELQFSKDELVDIRKKASKRNVTIFSFLLTCFYLTLYKLTNCNDIVIGIPITRRKFIDLEPVVGLFANMLPIRTAIGAGMSTIECLQAVAENVSNAMRNMDVSYNQIVADVLKQTDLSRNPLFDCSFSLDDFDTIAGSRPAESLGEKGSTSFVPVSFRRPFSRFDLVVNNIVSEGELTCRMDFSTDLFARETAEEILNLYRSVVTVIDSVDSEVIDSLPAFRKNQADLDDFLVDVTPLTFEASVSKPDGKHVWESISLPLDPQMIELFKSLPGERKKEAVLFGFLLMLIFDRQTANVDHILFGVRTDGSQVIPVKVRLCPEKNTAWHFDEISTAIEFSRVWFKDVKAGALADVIKTVVEVGNQVSKPVTSNQPGNFILRADFVSGVLNISYDQKSISSALLESLMSRVEWLAVQIGRSFDQPISMLKTVTAAETEQIMRSLDLRDIHSDGINIITLFDRFVMTNAKRVALTYGNRQVTYAELDEMANNIAAFLISKRVKRNVLVALVFEPSVEMIASLLGVLKAGGAYLPIAPDSPEKRIEFILKDSAVDLVLTTKALKERSDLVVQIFFEDIPVTISKIRYKRKNTDFTYLIYTSGTTGQPKGVLITDANLLRLFCQNEKQLYKIGPDDVWLLFHSYAFDFSVWEIFGALFTGGRLVIVDKSDTRDSGKIRQILVEQRVTVFNQTPSAFYSFIDEELKHPQKNLGIKTIVFGGEELKTSSLQRWILRYPETTLINMYGITEIAIHATQRLVTRFDANRNNSSVGIGLPGMAVIVCDKHGNLLPEGKEGEMLVSGEGVAAGYLNRPELTSERFVKRETNGAKEVWYKSGDLGMFEKGEIKYIGRMDRQVQLRGHRIELGEIESQIRKVVGGRQVVVNLVSKSEEVKLIHAYVVGEKPIDENIVRREVAQFLPGYMVPHRIIHIETLPLTSNGKIAYDKLPVPAELHIASAPDLHPMERNLTEIWSEVLQLTATQINGDSNFFHLGGSSLHLMNVASRIAERQNRHVQVADLFEYPTLSALAKRVSELPEETERILIRKAEDNLYYRLSSAQEGIYAVWLSNPDALTYNIPLILQINEDIDHEKLERCLNELVARHESLRTSIVLRDGIPYQTIAKTILLKLNLVEIEESKVDEYITDFVRPFNLEHAPLARACHLFTSSRAFLLLDIHHIITDAISNAILACELDLLLRDIALEAPEYQYRDYSEWLASDQASRLLKIQEGYWLNEFAGGVPGLLNLSDDSSNYGDARGSIFDFSFAPEDYLGILRLEAETGATRFMILLAAYSVLLSRYSSKNELVIGTPVSGRRHSGLNATVGVFVNMLPLKIEVDYQGSCTRLLQEIKSTVTKGLNNQEFPYHKLVQALQSKLPGKRKLNNVAFTMLHSSLSSSPTTLSTVANLEQFDFTTSKYDLLLFAIEKSSEMLVMRFEYPSSRLSSSTVQNLANNFILIIREFIRDPSTSIGSINLGSTVKEASADTSLLSEHEFTF